MPQWLRAGEAMALIGVHTRKQFLKMVEAANVRTLTDKDEMRARGQFAHGWQWYHRHDLERLRST